MKFDLPAIKDLVQNTGSQLKKLDQEIEQSHQEIERLQDLPIGKIDMRALLEQHCEATIEDYRTRLQNQFEATIFPRSGLDVKVSGFPIFAPHAGGNQNTILPVGLIAMMGAQIKENLNTILDGIDWPEGSEMPLEERRRKIEKIGVKLEKLEKERKQLRDAAEEAGLRLD